MRHAHLFEPKSWRPSHSRLLLRDESLAREGGDDGRSVGLGAHLGAEKLRVRQLTQSGLIDASVASARTHS